MNELGRFGRRGEKEIVGEMRAQQCWLELYRGGHHRFMPSEGHLGGNRFAKQGSG
jgi:hypothetical protein